MERAGTNALVPALWLLSELAPPTSPENKLAGYCEKRDCSCSEKRGPNYRMLKRKIPANPLQPYEECCERCREVTYTWLIEQAREEQE